MSKLYSKDIEKDERKKEKKTKSMRNKSGHEKQPTNK